MARTMPERLLNVDGDRNKASATLRQLGNGGVTNETKEVNMDDIEWLNSVLAYTRSTNQA